MPLRPDALRVRPVTAAASHPDLPRARAVLDTLQELIARGNRDRALAPTEAQRLEAILGDLDRALEATAPRRRQASPLSDDDILRRAHAYVVAMARLPSLRVTRVAAELGISVRRLHIAFTNHDTTIARLILETRLSRARLDLTTLAGHRGAVSIVSARWGFATPASFSRAFRREFGMSPGAWMRSDRDTISEGQ